MAKKKKTNQPAAESKFLKDFKQRAGRVDTGFARHEVPIVESRPNVVGSRTLAYVPIDDSTNRDRGLYSDQVYINRAGIERARDNSTLGIRAENYILNHEMSHVQQHQYEARSGQTYDEGFIKAYQQAHRNRKGKDISAQGAASAIAQSLRISMHNKESFPMIEEMKGDSTKGYYGMDKKGNQRYFNLSEQTADLHAVERMTNQPLTMNPKARKVLLADNPVFMDAYDAMTGYRLDRYDARDLPPATPTPPAQTSWIKQLKKAVGWR